jgi:hypothetical protein
MPSISGALPPLYTFQPVTAGAKSIPSFRAVCAIRGTNFNSQHRNATQQRRIERQTFEMDSALGEGAGMKQLDISKRRFWYHALYQMSRLRASALLAAEPYIFGGGRRKRHRLPIAKQIDIVNALTTRLYRLNGNFSLLSHIGQVRQSRSGRH